MNKKLLVIISTEEEEKALTGLMFAYNTFLNGWVESLELFFFGPSEKLIAKSEKMREYLNDFVELKGTPIACKFIADRDGNTDELKKLGLEVEYVGEKITNLINDGFIPMVW